MDTWTTKRIRISWLAVFCIATLLQNCTDKQAKSGRTLFTELPADSTGIQFTNQLEFDKAFNIYTYRNFYNGGGVGLGDFNHDGLIDIYLTSNQKANKLFLNQGGFRFADVTDKAGVAGTKSWSTGVSIADVNGDGWLDIYVCNSGDVKGDDKENELFINNKDMTFTERAAEFGIADRGFTTHAVFFDYDKDGDLDLYILNNSYQAIGSFNLGRNERGNRDELGGDKLMRNDDGHFTDVSGAAGIYGSVVGFGLGVTVGDVNKDGWLDIYVSNDFFERDYLYINKHDGTFSEQLTGQMKSISAASMGADMADINNDTWPDIFVTEMLPEGNERIKTVTTFESWDRYQNAVVNGYYHQFTRNMLQLNNGNMTFSEVGRLSGVEATDWSWGALMFDMDNDGLRDIFVANGIYQDLTNQDYLLYASSEEVVRSIITNKEVDYKKLVELIPSKPVPDYAFHNEGNLKFTNKAQEWGLATPNFSNGSAYGDLDNDGDMDLVVSRVNEPVGIIRNESSVLKSENHFLKFDLKGSGKNSYAVGASITLIAGDKKFYAEQVPNRGFESSVDPRLHFGLGSIDTVDQILVSWPDDRQTVLHHVPTNQIMQLDHASAVKIEATSLGQKGQTIFTKVVPALAGYKHIESDFVDFDRDKLIDHMLSTEGPRVSVGDVNRDGKDDFYLGGAKGIPGTLFIQSENGKFVASKQPAFEKDKVSEDMESVFFDADKDGDADLYVCSGSNEFSTSSSAFIDRLYFNDGHGQFTRSPQVLPTADYENSSTVKAADYDKDGDIDLFVGVRSHPFLYGNPRNGYILNNNGKGEFKNVAESIAPGLTNLGLITDASWNDVDGDSDLDLIVVGEYMPVKVFLNEGSKFTDVTEAAGLKQTNGWWNRIEGADLDGDGDVDFVVANHGLNSRFRASYDHPISMYVKDFDKNGSVEEIICTYNGDNSYPISLRHDLVAQIPSLKKKYLKYDNYKDQTIEDIFGKEELKDALRLDVYELKTSILLNDGKGKFTLVALPAEAQYSSMYSINVSDYDEDGKLDILLGGNLYSVKPEIGRYDASYGAYLQGDGKGGFQSLPVQNSGFAVDKQVRDMAVIKSKGKNLLMVVQNGDSVVFFKRNKE